MEQHLRRRVESTLAEAEQAIDPKTNGLMAQADFNRVIAKLVVTTRRVLAAHQKLERERAELAARLKRVSRSLRYAPRMSDSRLRS